MFIEHDSNCIVQLHTMNDVSTLDECPDQLSDQEIILVVTEMCDLLSE